MSYEVVHLLLVTFVILLSHLFKPGQIFLRTALPFLPNFLHDVKRRNFRLFLGNADPRLPYEEHVSSEGFFWHLVQQGTVVDPGQLGQLH